MRVSVLVLFCPWCATVGAPVACYRNFFTRRLPPRQIACATNREQNDRTVPNPSLQSSHGADSALLTGYGVPTPGVEVSPQPYRLGRRALGALLGAGALGLPSGDSWAGGTEMKVVTFDGAAGTTQPWGEVDDSTYRVGNSQGETKVANGMLTLDGKVGNTKQGTPGFIITRTGGEEGTSKKFPDVSTCEGISLVAKASSPYQGYRFSIANKAGNGYKAKFDPPVNKFGVVKIPFKDLTNSYDDIGGMPVKTCAESEINCITFDPSNLKKIGGITFWAEGTTGDVHLEIKEISAYGCAPGAPAEATESPTPALLEMTSAFKGTLVGALSGLLVFIITHTRRRPVPIATQLLG